MLRQLLRSSLFRAASLYGVGNMLRQALPVLLVPVLTRYLSPADYGTMAMFGVLVNVLTPFVGVNVHGAINRKYFDRDQIDFASYVSSCLLILCCASGLTALVLWLGQDLVAHASELPRSWVWGALAVASGQMVTTALLGLLQAAQRPLAYSAIQIARTAAVAGLTLWLVVAEARGWQGSLWAQVWGALAFALISIQLFQRGGWLRGRGDSRHMRHALGFGLPLVPYALSGVAIQTIDRLFVSHYTDLSQTGMYSLGYQLGIVIGLIDESFDRALQPWIFERLKSGDERAKRNIVLVTYGYFIAIAGLAVGLGLTAPFILSHVVAREFHGASIHVIWIALGYAFNGMCKTVGSYLFYVERTGVLAWLTFASACFNVALNSVLVPRFGAVGAAQATTGAFLLSFLLTWLIAARLHPMPWLLARKRTAA